MLSSSARLDKSRRKKKPHAMKPPPPAAAAAAAASHTLRHIPSSRERTNNDRSTGSNSEDDDDASASSNDSDDDNYNTRTQQKMKRPKKQHSAKALAQIHHEEIAAFRRRMGIRLSSDNKQEVALGTLPDPVSSFKEWKCPTWWREQEGTKTATPKNINQSPETTKSHVAATTTTSTTLFHRVHQTILTNIENGKWLEPTPIQMQAIPSLMERRDIMGCSPTGSGKSGAFVLPALMLAKCSEDIYYGKSVNTVDIIKEKTNEKKSNTVKTTTNDDQKMNLHGHIRSILLAPSRELASQLHREVHRLSSNMPGKFHCTLLSKSNAGLAVANQLGGKCGLDCLVATPLRLVECIERGMKLRGVRLIILDEADRLLDASDGRKDGNLKRKRTNAKNDSDDDDNDDDNDESGEDEEEESENEELQIQQRSGSSQSRSFLQQIDSILSNIPSSATRALFSATLGPSVRHLSESILRSPIDITTGIHAGTGGNAAAGGASEHIQQELKFVGREEGKLLAIRQLVAEGITPPVLIFMQSKERAQALFGELLYDGIRVDVIHAGRSYANRELSVQKFRRGETWVLICTDLVARGVDFKAVNLVINYDLPAEGVTYVHRIGRTGRAGRPGRAITFFTEADFDNLRTIANVMRLSGCSVPDWMLTMKKQPSNKKNVPLPPKRGGIDTSPFDMKRKWNKRHAKNARRESD